MSKRFLGEIPVKCEFNPFVGGGSLLGTLKPLVLKKKRNRDEQQTLFLPIPIRYPEVK